MMGIVGPLLLGTVLALAFGGSGPSFSVAVVDLDRSQVSSAIATNLTEGPDRGGLSFRSIETEVAARAALDDGDIDVAVVLPSGYASSLSEQTPLPLQVLGTATAPTRTAVGRAIANGIAAQADLRRLAVAAALVDDPIAIPPDAFSELTSAIDVLEAGPGDRFEGALYFGPLAVFLFLGLAGTARGMLRDEREGVLARIRAAPLSPTAIVAGNAGTVLIQGIVAATVVAVASSLLFGARWGQPVDVAAVLAAFVLSVAGLLGLLVGIARSELQAESWSNVMAFTFAVLGGSFFGGALLPGVLGVIGSLTPNGAAMRALIELGPGERTLLEVWYLLLWLCLTGVGGLLAGARLLQRRWR